MVIVSAKISKRKLLLGLIVAVCVILLLALLLGKSGEQTALPDGQQNLSGASNEDRLNFLRSYGWEVDPEPAQTQEVRVPQEWNDVFTRYNEMQREQGFDLSTFAGKTAKRYVYTVTNHPDGEGYYATILVHKDKIIGGDVTSTSRNGRMHGFARPE